MGKFMKKKKRCMLKFLWKDKHIIKVVKHVVNIYMAIKCYHINDLLDIDKILILPY